MVIEQHLIFSYGTQSACHTGNRTTRRQTNSRLVKSRTGQLADWSTRRKV